MLCIIGAIVSSIECLDDSKLDKLLTRLWEIDQIGKTSRRTDEEKAVEENFVKTHWKDWKGRFVVTIPLKEGIDDIGSSRDIALRRLYYLERKLESDPELRTQYVEFMREYERLGHMKVAAGQPKSGELTYYIPHHCVTKKFRVVFDASCKTDRGISLNDVQMLGEKLQKDLYDIIR